MDDSAASNQSLPEGSSAGADSSESEPAPGPGMPSGDNEPVFNPSGGPLFGETFETLTKPIDWILKKLIP